MCVRENMGNIWEKYVQGEKMGNISGKYSKNNKEFQLQPLLLPIICTAGCHCNHNSHNKIRTFSNWLCLYQNIFKSWILISICNWTQIQIFVSCWPFSASKQCSQFLTNSKLPIYICYWEGSCSEVKTQCSAIEIKVSLMEMGNKFGRNRK